MTQNKHTPRINYAKLRACASKSYVQHCADPIAAAEEDLFGQALNALQNFINGAETGAITSDHDETFSNAIVKARAILAQRKEKQP